MKLLYITNQICGSGGLERVLSIKANYLADQLNYDVHIITLNQADMPLFYSFSKKLVYHDIQGPKANPISYLTGIRKKVKEIRPDIISVCDDGLKGFFLPQILGKPCPMIYERHASKDIFKTTDNPSLFVKIKLRINNTLMNFGASKYNAFVVLTNDNLNEWHLKNLKVIANPLSFYPETKAELVSNKVISVGTHNFQKGFDRLLKIWSKVILKYPEWTLDIYGKYDEAKSYISLCETLNLNKSVTFYAPVKNIEDKYKASSIYVMSSRSEGFGMVLIEAMANGVPCVSFDCPRGPKDIISEGEDGFLVKNGDLDTFSERLQLLIKDANLRMDMGEKARQKAKTYLPECIIPQWDALFKNLISST